jgi:uncharacterized protein YndB with AHSA1/START domain
MTQRAIHGHFAIERLYDALPARVFAAWAHPAMKARWFIGPPDRWRLERRALDFRVGGEEILHGRFEGGPETLYTARYHDIAAPDRIVFVYDVRLDGVLHSTALASVELASERLGTKLVFAESTVYFDGANGTDSRRQGTAAHLDRLATALADPVPP